MTHCICEIYIYIVSPDTEPITPWRKRCPEHQNVLLREKIFIKKLTTAPYIYINPQSNQSRGKNYNGFRKKI